MDSEIKQRLNKIKKGEVPEGYKETKIGIIPEDWDVVRLSDVVSAPIVYGIVQAGPEVTDGYPYIKSSDVGGSIDTNSLSKTSEIIFNKYLRSEVNPQDIIFSLRGNIGETSIVPFYLKKANLTQGTARIRINQKNSNIFFDYILNSITTKKIIFAISKGSTFKEISLEELRKILVSKPLNQEQQKISKILSTWDNAIVLKENLLEEKNNLKKCLLQNILTGKKRFSEFDDNWLKINLRTILKERKTYAENNGVFEHISLTKKGVVAKSARYERDFLVKDENKSYKLTYKNDICYNPANLKFGVICRNTFGTGIFSPIYVTFEVIGANVQFVEYLLTQESEIRKIRRYEEGTVYERIAVKPEDFLKHEINLPSIEEQNRLVEVISTQNMELENLKKELSELKEQKKGLMQLLLTGIVRVKVA